LAKLAPRFETIGRACDVDLPANPPPHPFLALVRGNARNFRDLSHKLMPRRPSKIMVSAQDLHVGVANSRQPHAHQRPPAGATSVRTFQPSATFQSRRTLPVPYSTRP